MARDLVALHATDPASVFLAVAARTEAVTAGEIEAALYEQRTLVRILGMRRTVWVVPHDVAGVVQAACTQALCGGERRKLIGLLEEAGIAPVGDGDAWLRRAEEATFDALRRRGEATASELSADVPALREGFAYGEGKRWEGVQRISTRVLFLLAAEGRIVRGRPRGSWTSTQYRWAPAEAWLAPDWNDLTPEVARVELARLWLHSFGPATAGDLQWWTGWTARVTHAALAAVDTVEVDLDGGPGPERPGQSGGRGLLRVDDLEPVPAVQPAAALLPGLDPTVMGWKRRDWYLGQHGPALFDRAGNAGPTVWWDGRVVGGWAQRKDGEIVVRLLDDVGADGRAAVEGAVDELARWLGAARVVPRFGTPLVKELMA